MRDYRLGKLKGQFVVVWNEGGSRRRYRLGTNDPATARAALREFVRARERYESQESGPLTLGEIWDSYVSNREAAGKSSVSRMKDAWKQLEPTFKEITAPDLSDGQVINDYTRERRDKGIGDGTIHTELGYLRAAISLATKQGKLTSAPFIALPPKPRPRSRHLTGDEARALLEAAASQHIRLFILLALYTAGRPSSILDLTWDRVDMESRVIHLDNPARDKTAKGRATVPIADALHPELEEARRGALTSHVIEWAGNPVSSVKKGVARSAERAGLSDVTPYLLRHTAAVWMAQARIPIEEISQYLGHTTPAVTFRVYARYSPDHLRQASDAINTVLLSSLNQSRKT